MASFIIETNSLELIREIKETSPDGISIQPVNQDIHTRADPSNITVEFIVNIDLHKILIDSALIYLGAKCSGDIGKTYFKIKGKPISVNDPRAIEMVKKEINQ